MVTQEQQGTVMELVILQMGSELYGADIALVREVGPLQRITVVPRTPPYVIGVTNLRGRVIPVIDLRMRFGLPATEPTRSTRIAVAELDGGQVGLIVDGAHEVLRVPASRVEPVTAVVSAVEAEYLSGVARVGDRLIILLDLARVLYRDDRRIG